MKKRQRSSPFSMSVGKPLDSAGLYTSFRWSHSLETWSPYDQSIADGTSASSSHSLRSHSFLVATTCPTAPSYSVALFWDANSRLTCFLYTRTTSDRSSLTTSTFYAGSTSTRKSTGLTPKPLAYSRSPSQLSNPLQWWRSHKKNSKTVFSNEFLSQPIGSQDLFVLNNKVSSRLQKTQKLGASCHWEYAIDWKVVGFRVATAIPPSANQSVFQSIPVVFLPALTQK